jgi:Citrate synthase, C-terminal domain
MSWLGPRRSSPRRTADGVWPPRISVRPPKRHFLRSALERLGECLGPTAGRLAFAAEVERYVGAAFAQLKPGRPPLQPNVETNAALVLDAVGLPRDAFLSVFALARSAGWLAHAMAAKGGAVGSPVIGLCRSASRGLVRPRQTLSR